MLTDGLKWYTSILMLHFTSHFLVLRLYPDKCPVSYCCVVHTAIHKAALISWKSFPDSMTGLLQGLSGHKSTVFTAAGGCCGHSPMELVLEL